jgi:hypothetical protein
LRAALGRRPAGRGWPHFPWQSSKKASFSSCTGLAKGENVEQLMSDPDFAIVEELMSDPDFAILQLLKN